MTIAPVVTSVEVKAPPARAFEIFTGDIGRWWPAGKTVAKTPHVNVVIEPRAGGRWYEIDAEGAVTPWGEVMAWEPPRRLLLGWRLNSRFTYDADFLTEVELTFAPRGAGTLVTLEHRNLERFGDDADKLAGQLGGGWPTFLGQFASFADDPRA